MRPQFTISLPKTVFAHNIIFLSFFFLAPKIYLFDRFGLRLEDLMYPATLLLFLPVFKHLKGMNLGGINKAVGVYVAYIFIQGVILSPMTGGFKYFILIFLKQLQYFILFYLLVYTFKFKDLRRITMKFIALLAGSNLLWALFQIATGSVASYRRSTHEVWRAYGIGAIGENQPHQAAVLFLFCFLFAYVYKRLPGRKVFIVLSAAAIFMTLSRITIAALLLSLLYIVFSRLQIKSILVKPLITITVIFSIVAAGIAADRFLTRAPSRSYIRLKERVRVEQLERGLRTRLRHWNYYLDNDHYTSYRYLNAVTGMGRGYPNTITEGWTMHVDSGYIRDFMEIGIVGLFLHLYVFLAAGEFIGFKKYLVVLLPFLGLSVTYEVFLVARSGVSIMLLTAILYGGKIEAQITGGDSNEPARAKPIPEAPSCLPPQ